MVNEFYAALLNKLAINTAPGADFVPDTWQPRHENTTTLAIRRALLISPDSAVAANWRANEIRRVMASSDMSAMLKRFDARTGYSTADMQADMVGYLRPQISTSSHPERVKVFGRLKTSAFEIRTWKLKVNENNVAVTESNNVTTYFPFESVSLFQIVLPGTDVRVSLDTSITDNIFVTLGSAPRITLADTGRDLRESLRSQIVDLANLDSTLDGYDRKMLRDIVLYNGETGAQLGAAASLLVGVTLASPPIQTGYFAAVG